MLVFVVLFPLAVNKTPPTLLFRNSSGAYFADITHYVNPDRCAGGRVGAAGLERGPRDA